MEVSLAHKAEFMDNTTCQHENKDLTNQTSGEVSKSTNLAFMASVILLLTNSSCQLKYTNPEHVLVFTLKSSPLERLKAALGSQTPSAVPSQLIKSFHWLKPEST